MKQRIWQLGLPALAILTLAACGGGQSGAGPTEQALAASDNAKIVGQMEPAEATGKSRFASRAYIVRLADEPVTAYRGGVKGYAATKPASGKKIDPNSPGVTAYMGYLAGKQDAALASVGGAKKLYNYGYVFNGFAAELTEAQALKLVQTPGVLSVAKDVIREMDTANTPAFLGLSGDAGFWKTKATGENVIIGVLDSGVWPEHPSFSDRVGTNGNATKDGKLAYQQIPGWHGRCVPGEAFAASNCNHKLIGARYYNEGFGGNAGIDEDLPHEFNSPRDHNGHGSHTASTAGGNAGVQATGLVAAFGQTNGIAPRARIAAYKVCWSVPGTAGSCSGIDTVAAIDQAVADGVDVLNYSVSGSRTNFRDSVEIAFMYAADAGVFVATSAGNSGPAISTVAHPGPWLTTVAAGTHNRAVQGGSLTLGTGATFQGLGNVTAIGPLPLVDGATSGLPGTEADANLALCYGTTDDGKARLDPAKVAGKIVICNRGGNVLVNKALAVKAAGGLGMVLLNSPTSSNTVVAVSYAVPTVHLAITNGEPYATIKAYAATAGATATINGANIVLNADAPFTASFSSRGPLLASGSLLKPDLIAPGQDILAAVAPPGNGDKLFDLYSGTSMSSPHVAGLAALMKELKPGWSPMAIKSALMTTAYDVLDLPNTDPLVIFRQGAGHVAPMKAADPGLVFDSGFNDWLGFLCGTQLPTSFCTSAGVPVIEPSNFNGASIALGALAGSQSIKRTVTNVGDAETYTASVSGMSGFTVQVTPSKIDVAKNGKADFTVQFTRGSAALNAYAGGQLTWTGSKGHVVRVPIVARPVALAAPAEVDRSYTVTFGYTGDFTVTPRGLVAAVTTADTVADDPTDSTCSLTSPNAKLIPVTIAAGTTYARFSLFDADVTPGSDIDLCVFRGTTLVGTSGSGTSAEEVSLTDPTAGVYTVVVQGWGVAGSSPFKLHTWQLGSTAAGNMTAVSTPPTATLAGVGTVNLTFTGLATGTRYLGSIVYGGAASMPAPTIVRVDR